MHLFAHPWHPSSCASQAPMRPQGKPQFRGVCRKENVVAKKELKRRTTEIADQDRSRMVLLALTLGLTTLAFIIAKTGRDALFFQGSGGLLQLPLIYINIAGASLPLALIFVKAMKSWGARPARIGILSIAAGVIAAAAPFLKLGDNTL